MKTGCLELESLTEKKPITGISVVDSNILIYLVDATDKAKHEKAKKFIETIKNNPQNFAICLQNLREFCSIAIRKKNLPPEEIAEYIDLFRNSFQNILYDNEEDILAASGHCAAKKTIFWDSLIAATMQRNEIEIIYTENTKDFKNFERITAINQME